MVKPHIYRDTPLYWFMALAATTLAFVQLVSRPALASGTMEITFAGSCCEDSVCPVAAAMTSVGARKQLRHRFSGSETTLTLEIPQDASPRELWEALERLQRRPLRVVTPDQEFISKPAH